MNSDTKLNNKWILWYHDPLDTNWDIRSYKNLQEISNMKEFWEIYKFMNNNIVENSMLFMMRNGIKPLWEDEKNVPGGCWSFKITKGNLANVWRNLSAYLCGETLISNKNNYSLLNGISISPKKNFCIVKIWNGDKKQNNLELLNKIEDLPFDTCIFKEHK
jgi:hypothetical protein